MDMRQSTRDAIKNNFDIEPGEAKKLLYPVKLVRCTHVTNELMLEVADVEINLWADGDDRVLLGRCEFCGKVYYYEF